MTPSLESIREAMSAKGVLAPIAWELMRAFKAANAGDTAKVISVLESCPKPPNFNLVDAVDIFGLSLLHTAIARNNPELTWWLIQQGAAFFTDEQGRMPSTMAYLMEVDERLIDLVVDAEDHAFDSIGARDPQPFNPGYDPYELFQISLKKVTGTEA